MLVASQMMIMSDRCEKLLARWCQHHCSLWCCFQLLNFGL